MWYRVCQVINNNILSVMGNIFLIIPPFKSDPNFQHELTGEAILVNKQVLEKSLQHSCKMVGVFLVHLNQGSGTLQEVRRVYPNLYAPSVPSKGKRVAVVVGYQFSRKAT